MRRWFSLGFSLAFGLFAVACGGSPSNPAGSGAAASGAGGGSTSGTSSGSGTSGSGSGTSGSSGSGVSIPECGMDGAHLAFVRQADLPGRGNVIAWDPDGLRFAAGGHFRDPVTNFRYDTKIYSALTGMLEKSFECHGYWVVGIAWQNNPFLGEIIADGGHDHAVKIWDANGPGSTKCDAYQFLPADGGIQQLKEINGATTALAFSPDGRFLAGANRDRAIRIWQMEPGPNQYRVVGLWYDEPAGNFLSVAWSPDGTHLATGDKLAERVAVWAFEPDTDAWDQAAIDAFAQVSFSAQPTWFTQHPELVGHTPVWSEGGHGSVWNVRYSPDGTKVASASADGNLSVFDSSTGAVLFRSTAPATPEFHGLDWSPGGRYLAVGADDFNVYIFDAESGALYDTLTGHADLVTAVAWSPDNCTLASTAGGLRVSTINQVHQLVEGPDQTVRLWSYP